MSPPSKRENVEKDVTERLRNGQYILSHEAERRMRQRQVIWPEVTAVLRSGVHVPEYDQWSEEYSLWNYAIEGDTVDGRTLRIPVAFVEQDDVLIITVIDVQRRGAT